MQDNKYYNNSTKILHISTLLYFILIFFNLKIVNLIFSILYTLEFVIKLGLDSKIYQTRNYYTFGFLFIDLISGPVALYLCLVLSNNIQNQINIICICLISKIITCKSYILILKEIFYLIKVTFIYFKSTILFYICFCLISYFAFEDISIYFHDFYNSFVSLYQLSTFDSWNEQSVKQVRVNTSNFTLLYFLLYFFTMYLIYITTLISFFVIYFTNQQLQLSFQFNPNEYILVQKLNKKLGLIQENDENNDVLECTLFLSLYMIYAIIQSQVSGVFDYRFGIFAIFIIISIILAIYKYVNKKINSNFQWFLQFLRCILTTIFYIISLITGLSLKYIMITLLTSCYLQLFKSNKYLMLFLTKHYKVVIQYILILVGICYGFAVIIQQNQKLSLIQSMHDKIINTLEAFLLNLEIICFDGWGDRAHSVFKDNSFWVLYFLILVILAGLLIINIFTGEIMNEMESYIKKQLQRSKLRNSRIYYSDWSAFEGKLQKMIKQLPIKDIVVNNDSN